MHQWGLLWYLLVWFCWWLLKLKTNVQKTGAASLVYHLSIQQTDVLICLLTHSHDESPPAKMAATSDARRINLFIKLRGNLHEVVHLNNFFLCLDSFQCLQLGYRRKRFCGKLGAILATGMFTGSKFRGHLF